MRTQNNYKRSVTTIEKENPNVDQTFKILDITESNGSFLLIDQTKERNSLIYIVARFILLFNTLFFIISHNKLDIEELSIFLGIYILGILFFYLPNVLSHKRIYFNRTSSTIKKNAFFGLKEKTIALDKVDLFYTINNRFNEIIYRLKHKKKLFYSKIGKQDTNGQNSSIDNFNSTLSFLLWYMDKNRPLPPIEIFNEFRQKDYERRKAEGFPRPIYQGISTPETTIEQQKEREAIGGW